MGHVKDGTYIPAGIGGVAYENFKRYAQEVGRSTWKNIDQKGYTLRSPYGSAQGVSTGSFIPFFRFDSFMTLEVVGTVPRLADTMERLVGPSPQFHRNAGFKTLSAAANDIITCGADVLLASLGVITGGYEWFENSERSHAVVDGFAEACKEAGCAFQQGETAALDGIVFPEDFSYETFASVSGCLTSSRAAIVGNIQEGDAIVFLGSSGLQENGYTFVHKKVLPKLGTPGYLTRLPDGRLFGEALLAPSYVYVKPLIQCLREHISIHHAVHITGRGWPKVLEAPEAFVHVIEEIPRSQALFDFISQQGFSRKDLYSKLNMGAGFALYVREDNVNRVIEINRKHGIPAWRAGHVEKSGQKRFLYVEQESMSLYPVATHSEGQ